MRCNVRRASSRLWRPVRTAEPAHVRIHNRREGVGQLSLTNYRLCLSAQEPIQAPCSGTCGAKPEPQEAIDDGNLAAVQKRPEATRRVSAEVSDGHFARQKEGGGP